MRSLLASATDPDIRQALAILLRAVRGSEICMVELLAAALVERRYDGCFALTEAEAQRMESLVLREPVPLAIKVLLGDVQFHLATGTARRDFRSEWRWSTLLPYAVLHRTAEDFAGDLYATFLTGLHDTADHALGWWIDHETPMLRAWGLTRRREEVALSPAAQQAYAERAQRHRQERDAADPARNGRPEGALEAPRPELRDKFSWWSLQLGIMLKSPFADTARYLAVIDEIGDRCLAALPQAHAQAQLQAAFMRQRDPNYHDTDRCGTTENDSLPRYARGLIKRGIYERAIKVCEQALVHRIQPTSEGAFERALASATKKLTAGRQA